MKRSWLAALLLLTGAGLPGIGLDDRRVGVDDDAAPWRSVARVQTELGGRCSGFFIAPSVALTAAHCLWLPRVGRFIRPADVHVLAGYHGGAYAGATTVQGISLSAGYQPRDESGSAGADVAVLSLAAPIGAGRVLQLADGAPLVGAAAMLGGFGQDRAERIDADTACVLRGVAHDRDGRPMIDHSCEATRGTSGAPLLVRGSDGVFRAIGVQVLARIGASGGLAARLPGHDTQPQ